MRVLGTIKEEETLKVVVDALLEIESVPKITVGDGRAVVLLGDVDLVMATVLDCTIKVGVVEDTVEDVTGREYDAWEELTAAVLIVLLLEKLLGDVLNVVLERIN